MAIFQKAKKEICEVVRQVTEKYHGPLSDAGVLIQTLIAYPRTDENGDATSPALTMNGYKCAAKIRVLGLKDRVARGADAELLIDGDGLDLLSERQIEALVDHELTHIELQVDDNGNAKRDDIERPKLRIVKHDHQFGWFDATARRYGEDSPEVRQCRAMMEGLEFRQLYLFEEVEEYQEQD